METLEKIQRRHHVSLHKLQEDEELDAGNKLDKGHIDVYIWQKIVKLYFENSQKIANPVLKKNARKIMNYRFSKSP